MIKTKITNLKHFAASGKLVLPSFAAAGVVAPDDQSWLLLGSQKLLAGGRPEYDIIEPICHIA